MLDLSNLYTVQVIKDVFGFRHYTSETQMLQLRNLRRPSMIEVIERARPPTGRAFPSLVNLANEFIYVIGGYLPGTE